MTICIFGQNKYISMCKKWLCTICQFLHKKYILKYAFGQNQTTVVSKIYILYNLVTFFTGQLSYNKTINNVFSLGHFLHDNDAI